VQALNIAAIVLAVAAHLCRGGDGVVQIGLEEGRLQTGVVGPDAIHLHQRLAVGRVLDGVVAADTRRHRQTRDGQEHGHLGALKELKVQQLSNRRAALRIRLQHGNNHIRSRLP